MRRDRCCRIAARSQCVAFKRNTLAQSDRNGAKGLGGVHGSANRSSCAGGIESAQIAGVKDRRMNFLVALGRDVEIPSSRLAKEHGKISIVLA